MKYVDTAKGSATIPNTTNVMIGKSEFEKAMARMPVRGPGQLNDLRAPSYLYAIFNDERISKG